MIDRLWNFSSPDLISHQDEVSITVLDSRYNVLPKDGPQKSVITKCDCTTCIHSDKSVWQNGTIYRTEWCQE